MTQSPFRPWLLPLLVLFALSVYSSPLPAKRTHAVEKIDFKALEFTCSREQDHVPTPQAEALYQRANQAHAKATTGENTNVPLLKEAMLDYQKAAEAGHWKAARNLANLYHQGASDGTDVVIRPNADKALRYTQQLIDMNVATGYNLMAAFAYQGWGVRRDPTASMIYQRKAADLGYRDAQRQLGNKFYHEFNDLPAAEKAQARAIGLKMLACAVRQGDREAASDLASKYETVEGNYPYALFYYQQGGKMGDATCPFAMRDWFHDGEFGYARDPKRAERYYAYKKRADLREGPFLDLDNELPLPPPPKGGTYPPPEAGWPNEWQKKP